LRPTSGRVLASGRIAALLELGAGFNPEFTGRDNVYLNGEIMGISRREMEKAFPAIEAFAELGQFIDRPVKEYSSGMYVRLAFSTAIHIEPEILIVDEALAVGDAIFASRCIRKFEDLRQKKVTVLLVSHDLGLIKRLADRAIFMLEGQVVMEGTPKDAVNQYVGFVLDRERSLRPPVANVDENVAAKSSFRHGDGASRIVDVQLLNGAGRQSRIFRPGDALVVRIQAVFSHPVDNPVVGILIRNRIGMDVFGTNSRLEGVDLGSFEQNETLEIEFELDCLLSRQEYTLTVATQYWNGLSQDWMDDVLDFEVIDTKDVAGVLNLNARVRHRKNVGPLDSQARLILP
jgi:lipopolysaccharide transport system ATP-binding protein